jgi:hypothetical protein
MDAINARRASLDPRLGPIGLANVFVHVAAARADLALAAHYGGDFSTSEIASRLLELRHADMLRRARINAAEIQNFVEVTLADVPSVRDAIDAGDRTFAEFLTLLDKSDRFRQWLGQTRADEGLAREYIKSMTSAPWVQRMPARSLRYVITQGIDLLITTGRDRGRDSRQLPSGEVAKWLAAKSLRRAAARSVSSRRSRRSFLKLPNRGPCGLVRGTFHATRPDQSTDNPALATITMAATNASNPVNSVSRLLTCSFDPSF